MSTRAPTAPGRIDGAELHRAVAAARRQSELLQERTVEVLAVAGTLVEQARQHQLGHARVQSLIEEISGLRQAMQSRAVIEQAKGVLMATVGCDADRAFELLVVQSQHENRKLREIAEELVARHVGRVR